MKLVFYLKQKTIQLVTISSLLVLLGSACNQQPVPVSTVTVPAVETSTPVAVEASPTPAKSESPVATDEAAKFYPYFLPLVTKPDIEPQVIDGVTATIDWAYVDEMRVAIQYSISGLNWPDESLWDSMRLQITSPSLPVGAYSGGLASNGSIVKDGATSGMLDLGLVEGALDAEKVPVIRLNVELPVEGPTNVGTFHFAFDVPVLDGSKLENLDQTVTANDVSMTLKSLVLTPSHVQALICFEMPSPVDWGLTASTVTVAGKEFPFTGGGLAQDSDGRLIGDLDTNRCNDIGFDIVPDESATTLTLTVPKLMGSVPEVITPERLEMANQRLADQGIQFDYIAVDHGGNFEITQRPEGMDDAEIYPLLWDALAEQYEGPWVFTVPIER